MPVYIAESRTEAQDDVRAGAGRWLCEYFRDTIGRPLPRDRSPDDIADEMMASPGWIVGTPDDAVAALRRLDDVSGGDGGLLFVAHEWTSREKILKSYELFARYVMPQFQGSLAGVAGSNAWAQARSAELFSLQSRAIEKAHQDFERNADEPHS
jgi:limonene 1,2-monooxygenase